MKNIITNSFKTIIFTGLIICSFTITGNALASAIINSVKINNTDNPSIVAGTPATATISVSLTSLDVWKSTGYKFGNGNWICVDTPDHLCNTTAIESFLITAPSGIGINNVNFEIYRNNDCTDGLDMASPASLLTAGKNIFSLGTGNTWLAIILLLLIIAVVIFVIFFIIKRDNIQRTKNISEYKQ